MYVYSNGEGAYIGYIEDTKPKGQLNDILIEIDKIKDIRNLYEHDGTSWVLQSSADNKGGIDDDIKTIQMFKINPQLQAINSQLADISNKLGLGQYDSSILNSQPNLYDGATWVSNYYYDTSAHASSTYSYSSLIPIKAGETYQAFPRARFITTFDSNSNYLTNTAIPTTATYNPLFTATQDGFVRVSIYNEDVASIKLVHGKIAKVIYNFGDSIAAGAGNNNVGYADLVAQKYGMLCVDYAISGSTISKVASQSMGCILDHIDSASSSLPDIIYLEGASNDYTEYRVMGSVSSKLDFAGTYDITTFAGAVETAIYKLMIKYQGVPIIWVYSHQQDSRNSKTNGTVTVDYDTMHDLSIAICKKWSIPVVDMYEAGGLNTNLAIHKTTYTSSADGTHPNANGYNKFYVPKIAVKTRDIIAT